MTRVVPELLVTGFQFFCCMHTEANGVWGILPNDFFLKIIYSEIEPGDNLHE